MGSNVGTTSTSSLVSVYFVGNRTEFRRGFAVAAMHDFFNIFTSIIFLPAEWISNVYLNTEGPLERMVSLILHSKTHLRLCKHVLHDNINRKGYQHFKITNITGMLILYLS